MPQILNSQSSTVNRKSAPPPGYQQTKIGVLPVEWEVVRLEDVSKRGSGHTPNKKIPEYYDGSIKWVSLADSNKLDRFWINSTKTTISQEGINNSSAVVHPKGTVIVSRDAGVGKSAILADKMAVSQHFIAWQCGDKLDNFYLYYYLQRKKPLFERMAIGSTIKTIGLSFFKKFLIPLPPLPEQQKIASILATWDDAIRLKTQRIDAKKEQKRGLMQRLLTGEVRLDGFEGEWKKTRMDKILQELKKAKVKNAHQYELVTVKLYCKGIELTGKYPRTTEKGRPYHFREPGEIIVGRQNFHNGGVGIVPDFGKPVVASNAISSFRTLKGVDKDYILHAVQNPNFYRKVGHLIGGTGQKEVSRKEFSNLRLRLPPLPEQTAIAHILTTADDEITLLETQLDELKEQKRGLMQRLLTGQVRVNTRRDEIHIG